MLLKEALEEQGASFEVRSIGGLPTHLVQAGEGEASFLWLPALGDSLYSFGPVQLELARRFHGRARIIAVDPPGHGGTPAPGSAPGMSAFPELYAWAAALLDDLGRTGAPLIAAGNSSGAAIVTGGAAAMRAKLAGLIFVAWTDWRSGGCPTSDDLCPADLAGLDRLRERSWHRPSRVSGAVAARLVESLSSPARRRHVESFDPNASSALLNRYDGPLAIIGGRSDRLVPPPLIELAVGARAGTEVRWIDACGHYPHREKAGELVAHLADLMDRFLAPDSVLRSAEVCDDTPSGGISHGAIKDT